MRVFRRDGSPYYYMDGTVGGVRIKKSTKRTNKKEALAVAQEEIRRALDAQQLAGKGSITFFAAAEKYIGSLTRRNEKSLKSATYFYRLVTGRMENGKGKIAGLPDCPVHEITGEHLATLKAELMEAGYADNSIRNALAFVRTVCRYVGDLGFKTTNARAKLPKKRSKLRYLLPGEEAKLIAQVHPDLRTDIPPNVRSNPHIMRMIWELYDLTIFLLDTGVRYTEAAKVPWVAIDTDNWETLNLYRQKWGKLGTLRITDRLREVLQRRRADNPRARYVFQGRGDHARGHRGYATGGLVAAFNRAGLNDENLVETYGRFTPHSLRHSFASKLVQQGVSLYKVQALLGHSSAAQTEKYAHLHPGHAADEAVDVLNKLNEDVIHLDNVVPFPVPAVEAVK